MLSCVQLFATPWTVAQQAPLSMEFSSQNTGVGSLSLPQGIFPTQESNPGLPTLQADSLQLSHKGSPRILEWVAYPFSSGSYNPGIKLGSPALQANSLPTELSGKPQVYVCLLPLASPSHLPPIPTPLGYYRAPIWVPWVIQQILIGCLFTYVSVYASILLSPFISVSPPFVLLSSPPPLSLSLFSMSAFALLFCEQIHQYHPSRWHIYV